MKHSQQNSPMRLPRMEQEHEVPSPETLAELAVAEAASNRLLTERLEQLRAERLTDQLWKRQRAIAALRLTAPQTQQQPRGEATD